MNRLWKNKVVSAEEMRELDRRAIEEFGIPGEVLMESAGKGAFEFIESKFPLLEDTVIFCGKGNNGGDGFVIARYLLNRRVFPTVALLGRKEALTGDAKLNLDRYLKLTGELIEVENEDQLRNLKQRLTETDLIIDAIFGTGLDSEIKGLPRAAVEFINEITGEYAIPVLALDLPSGVNASTGEIMGVAVRAEATVTFGLAKIGHYCFPGAGLTGELEVIDIGIPAALSKNIKTFVTDQDLAFPLLLPRAPDSHKGDHGHTVIFAGSPGKTGAAAMASESALRSGAGLVTLAVPASLNDIFEVKLTEVMTEPIPDQDRKFGKVSIPAALEFIRGKNAIALGPGIGQGKEIDQFVKEILVSATAPVVVDADGLNSLANQMDILKKIQAPLILTPHPGEMSRLCGLPVPEIQKDRVGVARKFAKDWQAIVVLKGANTVIAGPFGEVFINHSGNAGMASAGMGDVLTGIIAGLLSQEYDPVDAAILGVYLHGKAGDLAGQESVAIGIIATDLIGKIRPARRWILDQHFGTEE